MNAVGYRLRPLLSPRPAAPPLPRALRLVLLAAALVLNWYGAAEVPSMLFSWTSLALLIWLLIETGRTSATTAILLLPLIITRFATVLSLMAIEASAYMPEVNRLGAPGDASASFVAVSALLFIPAALVIGRLERPALVYARSPLLDRIVNLLAWPVIAFCLAWGALAFLEGLRTGFPLLAGVDRFLYRRAYGGPISLFLLDNKFAVALLLGVVAFGPRRVPFGTSAATGTFLGLIILFFLFGDKFFTILTSAAFFAMPLLLRRRHQLGRTFARLAPLALALGCISIGATFYIYSGYGRLPLDRTATLVGERVAGQGELWFVASRDARRITNWDASLVHRYVVVLDDKSPPASAFANGVETYYFIQHYAPAKLAANFRRNAGWVQLTMGTEAMGLVMFGYAGLAVMMLAGALLAAFASLYLLRTIAHGFPVSIALATWTFTQIYFALQQASLWSIAAPGQVKRVLLFMTIELLLFAATRAEMMAAAKRRSRATIRALVA